MPTYEVGLMATKIARAPHVFLPSSTKMTMEFPFMEAQHNFIRFRDNPFRFWHHYSIKVAEQTPRLSATDEEELSDYGTPAQIKRNLYAALQGINRGIFGFPSAKKSEIGKLVELLESQHPTHEPTLRLEKAARVWKLIFSTITIMGSRRTKFGLRDFINLGDFFQSIDLVEDL